MSEIATPETSAPAADSTSQNGDKSAINALPDWAQKQISDANAEAAKFRVQKNDALAENKSLTDQITALTNDKASLQEQLDTTGTDVLKFKAAITAGVPGEHVERFSALLQGSTPEELTAHAAALKTMFGMTQTSAPAQDPSQGFSGGVADDPAAAFGALLKSHIR